ncbi:hypothetical protein, partial [Streptomyces atratus]|uniref:hypothetical protein n=1 Tax=Streptomyces atratus TaxID=1893 RepID=UPI0021A69D90
MRHPFRAGAAVVVLTAALAACGSSAEERGGAGPAAARAPIAAPSASAVSTLLAHNPRLPQHRLPVSWRL